MSIRSRQRAYYEALYRRHGRDAKAVDQRDRGTQRERFLRISRCLEREEAPSVHEIGCGLGDFGEYLREHHPEARYSGSDVCESFVQECQRRFPHGEFRLRDVTEAAPSDRYDFVTQSGLFNVPVETESGEWANFIARMLETMYAMAGKGISVNFLTSYADPERRRPDLHYQSEAEMLDLAVTRLSRHVTIDMSGPLYEFTLHVLRPEYVRALYPGNEFARYFKGNDG